MMQGGHVNRFEVSPLAGLLLVSHGVLRVAPLTQENRSFGSTSDYLVKDLVCRLLNDRAQITGPYLYPGNRIVFFENPFCFGTKKETVSDLYIVPKPITVHFLALEGFMPASCPSLTEPQKIFQKNRDQRDRTKVGILTSDELGQNFKSPGIKCTLRYDGLSALPMQACIDDVTKLLTFVLGHNMHLKKIMYDDPVSLVTKERVHSSGMTTVTFLRLAFTTGGLVTMWFDREARVSENIVFDAVQNFGFRKSVVGLRVFSIDDPTKIYIIENVSRDLKWTTVSTNPEHRRRYIISSRHLMLMANQKPPPFLSYSLNKKQPLNIENLTKLIKAMAGELHNIGFLRSTAWSPVCPLVMRSMPTKRIDTFFFPHKEQSSEAANVVVEFVVSQSQLIDVVKRINAFLDPYLPPCVSCSVCVAVNDEVLHVEITSRRNPAQLVVFVDLSPQDIPNVKNCILLAEGVGHGVATHYVSPSVSLSLAAGHRSTLKALSKIICEKLGLLSRVPVGPMELDLSRENVLVVGWHVVTSDACINGWTAAFAANISSNPHVFTGRFVFGSKQNDQSVLIDCLRFLSSAIDYRKHPALSIVAFTICDTCRPDIRLYHSEQNLNLLREALLPTKLAGILLLSLSQNHGTITDFELKPGSWFSGSDGTKSILISTGKPSHRPLRVEVTHDSIGVDGEAVREFILAQCLQGAGDGWPAVLRTVQRLQEKGNKLAKLASDNGLLDGCSDAVNRLNSLFCNGINWFI